MIASINNATRQQTVSAASVTNTEKVSSRFYEKLEQLFWVENQMTSFLAKAKKMADGLILKSALNQLIQTSQNRQEQLAIAFSGVSAKPNMVKSDNFEALIQDFDACTDTSDTAIRNAAIVFELQNITEFKIEQYSELCELAEEFNAPHVSKIAEQMLQSEICTDASLMDLSIDYLGNEDIDVSEFIEEDEF